MSKVSKFFRNLSCVSKKSHAPVAYHKARHSTSVLRPPQNPIDNRDSSKKRTPFDRAALISPTDNNYSDKTSEDNSDITENVNTNLANHTNSCQKLADQDDNDNRNGTFNPILLLGSQNKTNEFRSLIEALKEEREQLTMLLESLQLLTTQQITKFEEAMQQLNSLPPSLRTISELKI